MKPRQQEIRALYDELGNKAAVARTLNIDESTVRESLKSTANTKGAGILEPLGYNLHADERSPQDAWASHVGAFERKVSKAFKPANEIHRTGPFAIFHSTDEHLDDDGTPLRLIEADINAAHGMGAIMCHGGDLLNNWPLAGKLAKQWAEQSCTMPDALLRAQHFIEIFKPDVWTDGNHEEMNPYLASMFDGWLPAATFRDYWTVRFNVTVPGGRDCRVALSHKFQKGGSWFHKLHGHLREMLEGEDTDLYLDGHIHCDGVMEHTLPERGHSALLVASAGYKALDKYASRISRGGKTPKLRGRAHWVVIDPFADMESSMCVAFKDPVQAEIYLSGLQRLRAV